MNIEERLEQHLEGVSIAPEAQSILGGVIPFLAGAVIVALGGLLIGVITSFVSNLIYIVILFPLGMGFIGAMILDKVITTLKIRKLALGVFLGGLMALVIYGAYHYTDYQTFRFVAASAMDEKLVEETGESSPEVSAVFVDYALSEETGHTGMLGYILYKAKLGVSIGKIVSTNDFNLGPFFTWIYWLVELGIIGWMTVPTAKEAAGQPFCERCHAWYGKEEHLGGCSASEYDKTLQVLSQKNFSQLGEMLVQDAELPSLEVYMQTCQKCNTNSPWFTLKKISFDQKGKIQFQTLLQQYISASDKRKIVEAMAYNATSQVLPPSA